MTLVLDASMALAWLFERPEAEQAERADRALLALGNSRAIVPVLWHTEVVNALLVAEQPQVVTEAQVFEYLGNLYRLPIDSDDGPPVVHRDAVMALAREHGLSAYDAAYLALALRTHSILATFDQKLAAAAHATGGSVSQ